MYDYSDLGLNKNLESTNGIVSQGTTITGYKIGSDYERDAITSMQMLGLSANNIQVGTLAASVRIVVNDGTVDRIVIGSI